MRNNYKRLGDYIEQVNIRNDDEKVDLLLGVNLDKTFIKSVANTVGTDMSKYKIIKKGQFGCKLMSVGRDRRLPISRLVKYEKALISSAYFVFEVSDESILNPEYLMMWFLRSESDRYLWFQSGGDIRGRITWDEFCTLPIKIPPIEKQRQIVAEYNAVDKRIRINEQLNQKLEETAQAIYKHWFVDFEFPYVTSSGVEMPYKSSGGKMVYNEELDKEIPEGWEVRSLGEFIETINGFAFKSEDFTENGRYPIIKIKNIVPPTVSLTDCQFLEGNLIDKFSRVIVSKNDILISMTGSGPNQMASAVGQVGKYNYSTEALLNQRVCKLEIKMEFFREYLYQYISNDKTHLELLNGSSGSANQANISPDQIKGLITLKPQKGVLKRFQQLAISVENSKRYNSNIKLIELTEILLSKMSRFE